MAAKLKIRPRTGPLAVVALALVLSAGLAACGGSGGPTLTIGAPATAEETVLGQIYAQALQRAGFAVANVKLGTEAESAAALRKGRVSAYPGHLSTPTSLAWSGKPDPVPANPEEAYRKALTQLEKEGMTAFRPAPFSFTNLVSALRSTARSRGLKKVSDLEGQSEELTISGAFGCHEAINCVEGLESLYHLRFAGFIDALSGSSSTELFEALGTGYPDLMMLPSTDGRLFAEKGKITTLEDDRRLFPAGNAIFVTTQKLAKEAGPGLEEAVVAAQKGLTLRVMQELDAEVELEKQSPAKVAAEYLDREGLNG